MKTALIVAMQSEFDLMAKILQGIEEKEGRPNLKFVEGRLNGQDIVLMKSGIGKVCAAAATVELINNFKPHRIINTGLAGGIDKSLSVMDIVAGQDIVYHDVWCGEGNEYGQVQGFPAVYHSDTKLLEKIANIHSDTKIHRGLIASGDKFITDIKQLAEIKKMFPKALAVDMESAAIAQVCHLYNIPFLSLRIISDTPGIENHYQQYLDFWNKAPEKSLEIIKKLLDF